MRSLVGQQPSALEHDRRRHVLGRPGQKQPSQAFAKRDGRVKYLALAGAGEEEARAAPWLHRGPRT